MHTVKLGSQGLVVSAIGLGCMPMSQSYGKADREESARALQEALDVGMVFLDTADAYGWGHNESLIGEKLRDEREHLVLGTKFAIRRSAKSSEICARPEYVKEACEASLKRLGFDDIDLYYLHRLDPDVPIEETVGAMGDLVREGKVRYLGLSEVSATTLRRAHKEHPISAVQSEYSVWTRDPEKYILPTCQELGIGFVPFSPLGRAILTGGINTENTFSERDSRSRMPRFQGKNLIHNLAVIQPFIALAQSLGCTPAQLALAWLLAQEGAIVPIPGTKRAAYVRENARGTEVHLNQEQLNKIHTIINPETVLGARYDEASLALLDTEDF